MLLLATCWGETAIISSRVAFGAGVFAVGVALCLVLLTVRHRQFNWVPLYGSLVLFHPSWIMSVEAGDCGLAMRFLAVAASLLLAAILAFQIGWLRFGPRRFLLSICMVSWAAYLLYWPLESILSALLHFPGQDGGIASEAFLSWGSAVHLIPRIAIVLTALCAILGTVDLIRRRAPKQAGMVLQPLRNATAPQNDSSDGVSPLSRSRTPIRVLSLFVLLPLIALYTTSWMFRPSVGLDTILAIVSTALLITTAATGRLPGWQSARRADLIKEQGRGSPLIS